MLRSNDHYASADLYVEAYSGVRYGGHRGKYRA
jgi:hypothetical protein